MEEPMEEREGKESSIKEISGFSIPYSVPVCRKLRDKCSMGKSIKSSIK